MLHCFGVLVYASRLDVAEFLQQLCGADPFSWTMAQVTDRRVNEWCTFSLVLADHAC